MRTYALAIGAAAVGGCGCLIRLMTKAHTMFMTFSRFVVLQCPYSSTAFSCATFHP